MIKSTKWHKIKKKQPKLFACAPASIVDHKLPIALAKGGVHEAKPRIASAKDGEVESETAEAEAPSEMDSLIRAIANHGSTAEAPPKHR